MLPGECGRDLCTAHAAPKPLPAVREGLVSICGCQSLKGASSLPFAGPQTKPENKTPLSWAGGAALSTDHTHLEFPCWDVVQTRRRPCRLPRWQCPWWWRGWAHALVPLQGLAGVTPREGRTLQEIVPRLIRQQWRKDACCFLGIRLTSRYDHVFVA